MSEQVYPTRMGELFDYHGYLAQFVSAHTERDEPVRTIVVRVAPQKANVYPDVLRQVPWSPDRNWMRGEVSVGIAGRMWCDTSSWTERTIHKSIPQPRDGKTYTWKWHGSTGEWVKDEFPLCAECRKPHKPDLGHCEWCGVAISSGRTCNADRDKPLVEVAP